MKALETLAAVLEKLGLYQDCEGSILQITNALADHATSTTDDSDQSGAQEPGDREPVGQEPAQDGAEAPTAGEPSADVDAAEQPTCPTTNNPTLVTIRGEDFELARTRGMWHFRRPPERGWTNCDAEMVRLIEEQLSAAASSASPADQSSPERDTGESYLYVMQVRRDLKRKTPELTLDMAMQLLQAALPRPQLTVKDAGHLVDYYLDRNREATESHRKTWLAKHPNFVPRK